MKEYEIVREVIREAAKPYIESEEEIEEIIDKVMDAISENYRSITEIHYIVNEVRAGRRVQIAYFDPDEDDFMNEMVVQACW